MRSLEVLGISVFGGECLRCQKETGITCLQGGIFPPAIPEGYGPIQIPLGGSAVCWNGRQIAQTPEPIRQCPVLNGRATPAEALAKIRKNLERAGRTIKIGDFGNY